MSEGIELLAMLRAHGEAILLEEKASSRRVELFEQRMIWLATTYAEFVPASPDDALVARLKARIEALERRVRGLEGAP